MIEEMHFTHIRRRILKIKPFVGNLNLSDKPVTLIVDASGLIVTKVIILRGNGLERKKSLSNCILQ
jgi:hypothetical protein